MKRKAKAKTTAQLSGPVRKRQPPRGKPFVKGDPRINPGGLSKEKRDFLKSLREDDSATVYESMMMLVRALNPQAVLRAWEYIVGKPKEMIELTGKGGEPLAVQQIDPTKLTPEQLTAFITALRVAKMEPPA